MVRVWVCLLLFSQLAPRPEPLPSWPWGSCFPEAQDIPFTSEARMPCLPLPPIPLLVTY